MSSRKHFFHPAPVPRKQSVQLWLEELEGRFAPATFNPLPSALDGASQSLRNAILTADSNGDASNTISLAAGTYSLTDAAAGNLLLQDTASGVASKTFTLVGQGPSSTVVAGGAGWNDRDFQIVGANGAAVTVTFQNLTIEGGDAQNAGAVGGDAALGGGLLIDGAQVTLTGVSVSNNTAYGAAGAAGANGAAGSAGTAGTNGAPAEGGGVYLVNGTLTVSNSIFSGNEAVGGQGGQGGDGGKGADGATGATGSDGAAGANGANATQPGRRAATASRGRPAKRAATARPGSPAARAGPAARAARRWAAPFTWPAAR